MKKSLILLAFLFFASILSVEAQSDTVQQVFVVAEQQPEYPGGITVLRQHIIERLNYPEEARVKGIQGTVYLKVNITRTGEIGDVIVNRSIHELLDNEAIRVVKSLEKFKPGYINGRPASVLIQIPIVFKLD